MNEFKAASVSCSKKKHCVACDEIISIKASKCIHCDSFQDVRRFFPVSSTFLSLLIALISVFGLTFDKIHRIFEKPEVQVYELSTLDRRFEIINMSKFPISIMKKFKLSCEGKLFHGQLKFLDHKFLVHPMSQSKVQVPLRIKDDKKKDFSLYGGIQLAEHGNCKFQIGITGNGYQKLISKIVLTRIK